MTAWTSSAVLVGMLTLAVMPVCAVENDPPALSGGSPPAAVVAQASGQSGTGGSTEQPHTHGPGTKPHTHAASKDDIMTRARAERDRLIREQKLDASWKGVDEPTLEQKEFKGRKEWVATFQHPAPADKNKERLYMFFTLGGRFVAANHTGR